MPEYPVEAESYNGRIRSLWMPRGPPSVLQENYGDNRLLLRPFLQENKALPFIMRASSCGTTYADESEKSKIE